MSTSDQPTLGPRVADSGTATGENDTIAERPIRDDSDSSTGAAGSKSTHTTARGTLQSAQAFMSADEQQRLHTFAFVMLFVCCGGGACIFLLRGDPLATRISALALTLVCGGFAFVWWNTRADRSFAQKLIHRVVVVQSLGSAPIGYFFGVYSPYPAILGTAILVHALAAPPRYSRLAYAGTAGGWLLIGVLTLTGTMEDRGFIRAEMNIVSGVVAILAVQMVFAACHLIGRASRTRTEETVAAFEAAVRDVSGREALLREARLELERAAAIGGPGRFTGQRLGSYTLGVVLGRGGMGEIYAAEHATSGEPAAVKLLQRSGYGGADPIQRFAKEAALVGSLESPHVVSVYEVGGAEAPLPYLVMELLRGHDLAWLLRQDGRLRRAEVVALVSQVAEGLEAARAKRIVHRDLKPHNLFFTAGGVWKILDFGISRLAGDSSTLTAGHLIGTPAYMAPEQVTGAALDHRADVHALGVITYRALTGRPPFSGDNTQAVVEAVLTTLPPPPSRLREVSSSVDAVLRVVLAKKPEDRFENAREFAMAFAAAMRGEDDPEIRARAGALDGKLTWDAT